MNNNDISVPVSLCLSLRLLTPHSSIILLILTTPLTKIDDFSKKMGFLVYLQMDSKNHLLVLIFPFQRDLPAPWLDSRFHSYTNPSRPKTNIISVLLPSPPKGERGAREVNN